MEILVFENQELYAVERNATTERFIDMCEEYITSEHVEIQIGSAYIIVRDTATDYKPMMVILVGSPEEVKRTLSRLTPSQ